MFGLGQTLSLDQALLLLRPAMPKLLADESIPPDIRQQIDALYRRVAQWQKEGK